MKQINRQAGELNALLLPLIFVALLLCGAIGFGVWSFSGRQDYKNNVDGKIAEAVAIATRQVKAADQKEFAEAEKQPLKTYVGPDTYRSVTLQYPKTWSGYVTSSAQAVLDAYYHPGVVPGTTDKSAAYALRMQVVDRTYNAVVDQFSSEVKLGKVKITPYALPKVASIGGVRVDGEVVFKKTGSMIIVPLNDKTLKIWTESPEHLADFNTIILPNASFIP